MFRGLIFFWTHGTITYQTNLNKGINYVRNSPSYKNTIFLGHAASKCKMLLAFGMS